MKMIKKRKYISIFTVVSIILSFTSYIILSICKGSPDFADKIDGSICMLARRAFSVISNKIPFSLFEVLVCLIPLGIFLLAFISVRRFKKGEGRIKYLLNLLGIVLIIYTFYVFTLGIPYHKTDLSDSIGLPKVEVSAENLGKTAEVLIKEINTLSEHISYENGESKMPYDIDTLSAKISSSYAIISESYGLFPSFSSRAKPIRASGAMSSLRLLGIYTFFTGESNINVAYPDFDRPYTTAHEFAHQRGIMRENEANFIAFLVCIESDDDYIKYSGYLRLYEYIRSSLYNADKALFKEIDATLCDAARADIKASNAVTLKYGDSFIGELSNKINDFYLKQNGTSGVASYGLVTRLAVAYYSDADK